MLNYKDTPITEIFNKAFDETELKVFIKREDLNHQQVSGNKWWKLKYNLEEAKLRGSDTLLTFGGAYSNHVYATAAAAKELGFMCIGIIRGEEILPLNETLEFARRSGMQLHFVSREDYRKKTTTEFINQMRGQFGNFYLIPEGGTNYLAVKGCAEFAREKLQLFDFDYLCLPVGTGGTMAGIIDGLQGHREIIGFPVLKDGDFLREEVRQLGRRFSGKEYLNWTLETDYHFGGYAKRSPQLDQFMSDFEKQHNVPLDFVYTGKMVAGVFDLISKKHFKRGSKILMIHTGGLRN